MDWVVCFFDVELHELLIYLEINPLSVASFANIFSHSDGCLFILFMVSFAVKKLLSFIRSHLFIFVFISISLGDPEHLNSRMQKEPKLISLTLTKINSNWSET